MHAAPRRRAVSTRRPGQRRHRPVELRLDPRDTEVAVDPSNSNILYPSSFPRASRSLDTGGGVWRSTDSGATWTQIKPALNPANNADRAEFALNEAAGRQDPDVRGRSATQSDAARNRARFWRTDDAAGAAVFTDMTTPQNIGYCSRQCWYDNVVVSPPGHPDVVYLGGSYSYGQQHGVCRTAARSCSRPTAARRGAT